MTSNETANLKMPYIIAAQAQKHVTHNEALRVLDAITQLSVVDRDVSAPPEQPVDGVRYIVPAGASGPWADHTGTVAAYQDGGWIFYEPVVGLRAWVADEKVLVAWDGESWVMAGGTAGSLEEVARLGINATADDTNRLAVRSPAVLLDHAGGGHQVKVNKAAAGDTASVLFQTGYSGRAEFGTTGSDGFEIKVSPDGASWFQAMIVDAATGGVTFPNSGLVGQPGPQGPQGPSGGPVPTGGVAGQIMVKSGAADFAVQWSDAVTVNETARRFGVGTTATAAALDVRAPDVAVAQFTNSNTAGGGAGMIGYTFRLPVATNERLGFLLF